MEQEADVFRKALWIALGVFVFLLGLHNFPLDDGLRHVGLAFGDSRSWGEVYPFSVFEAHRDYDPWYGYDLALRAGARAFARLPLPPLLPQFVLTKLLSMAVEAGGRGR